MVKKFESEFTLREKQKCGRRSAEIGRALNDTSCSTSIRTIPKSSTHRILHNQLQLRPYKLQLLQDLKEEDYKKRVKFGEWFNRNLHEAYIHLNGDFSRYHCRILSESNPQVYNKASIHLRFQFGSALRLIFV